MLVVSDGEETVATPDTARSQGPPVLTVAVGGTLPVSVPDGTGGVLRDGAGRPVQAGVDVAALAELARASGGRSFRLSPDAPAPAPDLATALGQRLTAAGNDPVAAPQAVDRTIPCLALGLAILAVELLAFPSGRTILAALLLLAGLAGPARADTSAADQVDLGLTAQAAGRFAEAREHFLAARARDPDAPGIFFDLGTAYYRLGQFDQALAAFDRAARTGQGKLRANALYNQGNAAYRLGQIDPAAALYQAALAIDPDDADARANLQFVRSRPAADASDQPPQPERADQASRPGGDATTEASGQATQPGQAPAAQGQDTGTGETAEKTPSSVETLPDNPGPTDRPGPDTAAVPLAAREGMTAGMKRAQPDDRPGTPGFDRVPDLPGLPRPIPVYARPAVEKDW